MFFGRKNNVFFECFLRVFDILFGAVQVTIRLRTEKPVLIRRNEKVPVFGSSTGLDVFFLCVFLRRCEKAARQGADA